MRYLLLGVAVTLGLATAASAKQESAGTALKRVTKKTRKLKSYRVTATIKGGLAQGADHKITNMRVNKTFKADVVKAIASIDGGKAYRIRLKGQNGAIKVGPNWKALLATDDGRMIARLFLRPEAHLADAVRFSKKAKWLPPGKSQEPQTFFDEEKDTKNPVAKGTNTRKAKKKARSKKKSAEVLSHKLRVVAPPSMAVRHFNTIINSGCFSEG